MKTNMKKDRSKQCSVSGSVFVSVLLLSNLLMFQFSASYFNSKDLSLLSTTIEGPITATGFRDTGIVVSNALDFTGVAVALPSVRVQETEAGNVDKTRNYYGGKGDKPHLGGFATGSVDLDGVSPGTHEALVAFKFVVWLVSQKIS
jgi:hypothetical protein